MHNAPSFLEKLIAVFVVVAFSGTVLPVMVVSGGQAQLNPDSAAVNLVFGVVYVAMVAMFAMSPRTTARIPLADGPLLLLVALVFLSATWSIEPDITLRRAVAFLFTTAFAVWLSLRMTLAEALRVLTYGLSVVVALSLVAVVLMPSVGIDQNIHFGAWKGVFFQKNVAGRMLVWLLLALMWLLWRREISRPLGLVLTLAALLLLVMSRSGTSMITVVLMAVTLFSVPVLRADVRALLPVGAVVLVVAIAALVVLSFGFKDVVLALGRDPTLTGRTDLWTHSIETLRDHTLLGYGYGVYWYGAWGPGSFFVKGWGVTSAHNSWIDAMLDLGIPGVVLTTWILLRTLAHATLAARYGHAPAEAAWAFTAAAAIAVISLSESIFMEHHSLNWVVFVMASLRAARLVPHQPLARSPAVPRHHPTQQVCP